MKTLKNIDNLLINFSNKYSLDVLRISLGIIFLWFGFLKFFPGLSSAEKLAGDTINILTLKTLSPSLASLILAVWETLIGIGFLTKKYLKQTIYLMLLQMMGTFTPLVLFPAQTWLFFPVSATLEGQYIIKNLVLIAGALVLLPHSDKIAKSET